MALTLANTISATDLEIEVNGTVPAAIDIGYRFRLDNELLELRAFGRTDVTVLGGAATENVRNENAWVVERGLEATTPASHTSGASVLGTLPAVAVGASEELPAPFAGAGGTDDHTALDNLDTADQHPIAAVTGLTTALADLPTAAEVATAVSDHDAATAVHGIADTANIPQSQVTGLEAALAAAGVTITSGASIAADTTDTSTTVLGPFLTAHVGWQVAGPGIPNLATIVSVVNGTSAVISAAATATASITAQVSEPAPAGVGFWLRTGFASDVDAVAGLFYRAAVEDDWKRVGIGDWDANGVLRAFIGSFGGLGFDALIFDAEGNQRFQLEADPVDGSFSLTGTSADGFTKKGQISYDLGSDILLAELTIAGASAGNLYMDANEVSLTRVFGETFKLDAAGVSITSAGTFTFNGETVDTTP